MYCTLHIYLFRPFVYLFEQIEDINKIYSVQQAKMRTESLGVDANRQWFLDVTI